MSRRAAVCIGVNQAGGMTVLQAAVKGACDFEEWAQSQGYDTKLLVDDGGKKVRVADIFDEVNNFVAAGIYEQLIIYFSGHGILTAPGTEYWLLSGAPTNPNEAVNLFRSIEDARNTGIPHVVFISDACRSAVQGPPLSGISGGVIFPNGTFGPSRGEVDVFYAAQPGNPAWEAQEGEAAKNYKGIFTGSLLKAIRNPSPELIEVNTATSPSHVVTSRGLKKYLEKHVPLVAEAVNIKLHQKPEVRVETALPHYFATALASSATVKVESPPPSPIKLPSIKLVRKGFIVSTAAKALSNRPNSLREDLEVIKLLNLKGQTHFETRTGFSIFGAKVMRSVAPGWNTEIFEGDAVNPFVVHIRLSCEAVTHASVSLLLQFEDGTGTLVAIMPGFIGTIVVESGRVSSVNYIPSMFTDRYKDYLYRAEELERLKAGATVATRNGRFIVESSQAKAFVDKIRFAKDIDPIMGLYAAYSYAQLGMFSEVFDVYAYMKESQDISKKSAENFGFPTPLPFDVVMLASRYHHELIKDKSLIIAPFAPMLAQGWSMLMPDHPFHQSIHIALRPFLIPSLWTTYTEDGVEIILENFTIK